MPTIEQSRDRWKKKAMERRLLAESQHKRIARLEVQCASKDARIADLEKLVEAGQSPSKDVATTDFLFVLSTTRVMAASLFLNGRIPFRSIPRVMTVMSYRGWIPHFSSVINWVCRIGLSTLKNPPLLVGDWLAIIDMTIDIAFKKALVVLRLPLGIYLDRPGSISLSDVSFAGIEVREGWKSQDIAEALERIFGSSQGLRGIIKDGGLDLAKGVSIWKKSTMRSKVVEISDISHEAANALKADFSRRKSFQFLTWRLKEKASKIYQSKFAFLAPPKLRAKGRFMSIARLGKWLLQIQNILGDRGRAHKGSLTDEIRILFGGLGNLTYIADQLCHRSIGLASIMEILKAKGLNQSTYCECMKIVEEFPKRSASYKRITTWLRKHLAAQSRLAIGQTPLPVSSDILESLFGTFKYLVARTPKAELNHLQLVMPALCGIQSDHAIARHLEKVSQRDLEEWKKKTVGVTNRMKRRRTFGGQRGGEESSDLFQAIHA